MSNTMNQHNDLPNGWVEIKLGDVCDVVTGNTPPKNDAENYGFDIPFIKPPHLQNKVIGNTEEMLSLKGSIVSRLVPENTVLVTCIGNLGRTGITNKTSAFNQQINAILENEYLIGKFIFYQAQSPYFKLQLESLAAATTVTIVNKGKFETIKVVIPPLPEQHCIVAKIEELFSRLDKGIESLKTAQQQLKTYRQAVLKWAFEGRLTNKEVKEGELPVGWRIEKLGDFVIYQKGKKPKNVSKEKNTKFSIPYVTIKAFEKNIIEEYTDGVGCVLCEDGDFIMVWDGARSGYVGKAIKGALGSTLVKINFPGIILDYAYYYLQSKYLQINTKAKGTGIPHVDPNLLWNFDFPIPPTLSEQHHIVSEIEKRLSVADKLEEALATALQQAEALRQSILKKAFEGKLLSEAELQACRQDPRWEPASVLLERIRKEREAQKPAKTPKKSRPLKNPTNLGADNG
jgi:type I restriction enzyme S subunit